MLSSLSLRLQKSASIREPKTTSNQVPVEVFTGRIGRKLSVVFISLFLLVLLVGGSSLYLLSSHLYKSEVIARQNEQIDIVEQISRRLEAFASMIQLAHLRGETVADAQIKTSVSGVNTLLDLYQEKGGSGRNIQDLRQMVSDAQGVAARIVLQQKHGARFPNEAQIRELEVMETIQQRIEAFVERMSAGHEKIEDRLASASHRKMKFAIAVNTALLVVGSLLLLALNRYWRRAIVLPLRQLAQRSSEIAKGEDVQPVTIASRDEIGLLSHAFNRMALQIKEQQEKLKGQAILQERQRLAAELHDNLAQDLAFLRIKLLDWERSAPANRASTKQLLDELFPIVDEAFKNLREAIFGLRALALKSPVGLVAALGDFLSYFSEVRNLPVDLQVDQPDAIRFSPQVEIQLIRILHEALTNIVKHAQARRAKISIATSSDKAMVTIEDDGRGGCFERHPGASLHFGLETMKQRAESAGGKFAVSSVPGHGTKLLIELPLAQT